MYACAQYVIKAEGGFERGHVIFCHTTAGGRKFAWRGKKYSLRTII
jgi:hypothetical protein